jgi:accessory gene regulator protein AgrB
MAGVAISKEICFVSAKFGLKFISGNLFELNCVYIIDSTIISYYCGQILEEI